MQSFRKMLDYLKCNPNSRRPIDAMENRIMIWLNQDNAKALSDNKTKAQSIKNDKANNKNSGSDNTSYNIDVFEQYDIFD
jgi:hypothetical protein